MSEVIERVARTIATALGDDLDEVFTSKAEWNAAHGEKAGTYRSINLPMRSDYIHAAKSVAGEFPSAASVLSELREPTDAMFRAFMSVNSQPLTSGGERVVWEGDAGQFAASLRAMIDEVLK